MQRILVVEDEFLIAMHISGLLEDEGFEIIGPVASLSEAGSVASGEGLDGALLDVNIIGGRVDEVADILAGWGIPFMFVTANGRDHLPKNFVDAALVNKPFDDAVLVWELRRIICGMVAPALATSASTSICGRLSRKRSGQRRSCSRARSPI